MSDGHIFTMPPDKVRVEPPPATPALTGLVKVVEELISEAQTHAEGLHQNVNALDGSDVAPNNYLEEAKDVPLGCLYLLDHKLDVLRQKLHQIGGGVDRLGGLL